MLSMRAWPTAILALLAASVLSSTATALAAQPGARDVLSLEPADFRDPPGHLRPKLRWAWPGVAVNDDELVTEVNEMADAGFGGAEIGNLYVGLAPSGNPPETYMWGTEHWAARVGTAMRAGAPRDMRMDVTLGPQWPWASPAISDDLSSQYLAYGTVPTVGPSRFIGPPPPPIGTDPRSARLVAVTAAQPAEGSAAEAVAKAGGQESVRLDPATTVDISSHVGPNGTLDWNVPPGEWIIFGFWQAAAGQKAANFPVLDHFRRESTEAALGYLDRSLFSRIGGDLARGGEWFEDSLEFDAHNQLLWTGSLLGEFQGRRGYSLTRFLPVLFIPSAQDFYPSILFGGDPPGRPVFDFPGDEGKRVRHDYYETLTNLWVDEHLKPAREWARGHGMAYRPQVFGTAQLDTIAGAKVVDVPETEDFYATLGEDFMRTVSSGAHLSGARKTSIELNVVLDRDYLTTLAELKRRADTAFAAGVNQLVLYGYMYKHAAGAKWPSWAPFSSEYFPIRVSEGWTPTIPLWRHMRPLADYFARAQQILQAGRSVADVAVYRDGYGYAGWRYIPPEKQPEPAVNQALTGRGYTFDFVNAETLETEGDARRGRLHTPGSDYSALVVDLDVHRKVSRSEDHDAMPAATVRRLVEMAERDLPIVFVRRFPQRGVSYRDAQAEDASVAAAVEELKGLPKVRLVNSESDVPAALRALGVRGALAFDKPQEIQAVHRAVNGRDYWFLWNQGSERAEFVGSFATAGRAPTRWDLWSGQRESLTTYSLANGRVNLPLTLGPRESIVIGFDRRPGRHVMGTDADAAVVRGGDVVVRSVRAGTRHVTLDDGSRRALEFPGLPGRLDITSWRLAVEGAVPEGQERHDLRLERLADWRDIPELRSTSGTGTYRTEFNLDRGWVGDDRGAYLELGRVEGGVRVRVNGRQPHTASVPPERIDLGGYLRSGSNVIEIELTTNLRNRLHEMSKQRDGYQRFLSRPETQAYGLLGPVRLVAYAERRIPLPKLVAVSRRCVSRRSMRITVPGLGRARLRSVRATVNGRRVRARRRGGRTVHITLHGRPRGTFTVQITGRTTRGKAVRTIRRYKACRRQCLNRRSVRMTVLGVGPARLRSVRATVNGRRVRTRRRGDRTVHITLRGRPPRGTFTVRITGRTTRGKTVRATRRYKICSKRTASQRRQARASKSAPR